MGQQTSKHHAPLTFGYVNRPDHNDSESRDPEPHEQDHLDEQDDDALNDFVLANPHLYKLEFTCQNNCGMKHKRQSTASSTDEHPLRRSGTVSRPESVVVATKVDQECKFCRQNKRLSLVRRDLAEDLAYIDETYYPDVIHYVPNDDVLESELLQMDAEDDQRQPSHSDINWAKLTIGDVTPGRTRPRRLTGASLAVDLSGRALIKLSPSIGYLDNLTKLNLSHNQMSSLPRTIGYLRNLRVLNTSHNQLETLPDTISFLTKLTAINIAHNRVTALPSSIGSLPKLVVIIANDNQLTELPQEIANLHDLISLNIANNPLRYLPAGIGSLKTLRKLIVEGCSFDTEFNYALNHDPPSLFEICARAAVKNEITVPAFLSEHIKEYFAKEQTCSFCGGPFFESSVTRGRFIERNARQQIALQYRLCSAHWGDEDDRLLAMFASPPESSVVHRPGTRADVNTDGLDSHSNGTSLRGFGRNRAQSDASNRSFANPALSPSNSSQLSKRSTSSSSLMLYQQSSSYTDLSDSITIRSLKRQPSLPALPVPAVQPASSGAAAAASMPGSPPTRSSSPLAPRSARRPRASSSASVTRRLAGFLSPSPSSFSRSYSSSTLRQEQWNSSDRSSDTTPPATAANTMVQIDEQRDEAGTNSLLQPFAQQDTTEQDSAQRHANGPMRLWMPGQSQSNASISTEERTDHSATPRHHQQNHKQRVDNPLRAGLAHLGARFSTNRDRSGTV